MLIRYPTQNGSGEAEAEFNAQIAKVTADIERLAPNMKAMDRLVASQPDMIQCSNILRLDDAENKLLETEKEAEKARKDSKTARDQFNDVKKRRCVTPVINSLLIDRQSRDCSDASCLTRPIIIFPNVLIRCTRILRRARQHPWAVWLI